MSGPTLRAFVAVPLPESVTAFLDRLAGRIKAAGLRGRWVPSGNIHLTLKFLGDIDAATVDPLSAALARAVRGVAPIRLTPAGLGVFPRPQRARVLWMGLAGDIEALAGLQARVEAAAEALGHPREPRPWAGHLTLARARNEFDPQRLVDILQTHGASRAPSFQADGLVLYRSVLAPGGACYHPLARLVLGAGGAALQTGGTP